MPSSYHTSLWGQSFDLGLLQLVRSRISNVMWPEPGQLTTAVQLLDLGEKWMQLWTEINVVTLQKLIETMSQHAIIKDKGGPTKYSVCDFFLDGRCINLERVTKLFPNNLENNVLQCVHMWKVFKTVVNLHKGFLLIYPKTRPKKNPQELHLRRNQPQWAC